MSHIVVTKDPNDSTGRFAYALWHALSPIGGKFDRDRGVWVVPDTPAVRKALGKFKDLTRVPDTGSLRKNPSKGSYAWVKKLHSGDEVFWNDPDDGECSRDFVIGSIKCHLESGERDFPVTIYTQEGDVVECFASELS